MSRKPSQRHAAPVDDFSIEGLALAVADGQGLTDRMATVL